MIAVMDGMRFTTALDAIDLVMTRRKIKNMDELRQIYLELDGYCKDLAEQSRIRAATKTSQSMKLEEARKRIAQARLDIWTVMKDEIMIDWCNKTETPEPGSKYAPKDMPRNKD